MAANIKEVTKEEGIQILETAEPEGLFMYQSRGWFIGLNNLGEDLLTEGFKTREECEAWLKEGRW